MDQSISVTNGTTTNSNQNLMYINSLILALIIPIFADISKTLVAKTFEVLQTLFTKILTLWHGQHKCMTVIYSPCSRIQTDNEKYCNYLIHYAVADYIQINNLTCDNSKFILGYPDLGFAANLYKYSISRKRTVLPLRKVTTQHGITLEFVDNQIESTFTIDGKTQTEKIRERILYCTSKIKSICEIRKFLNECYDNYIAKIHPNTEHQYYFTPLFDAKPASIAELKFQAFTLYFQKDFSNLYFPEKETVLELLNSLKQKKIGKLGLLLYGTPGTGKTSLIKAIAKHTKRNIMSIKLSEIQNDTALLNIFHNEKIATIDKNVYDIPLAHRIYVLEDIDADSKIILARNQDIKETKEDNKEEQSLLLTALSNVGNSENGSKDNIMESFGKKSSKLTLSGILNVLDGILELPEAIIIMTTNHPEKLDPALTRYGRVNLTIEFKNMKSEDAMKLIKHHYPDEKNLEESLQSALNLYSTKLHDYTVSACKLEAFCQSSPTLESLALKLSRL